MRGFKQTLLDLKSLKIQGARNVAIESVKSLYNIVLHSKANKASVLLRELQSAKKELIKTRATEPGMRNALEFIYSEIKHEKDIVYMTQKLDKKIKEVLMHFSEAEKKLVEIGANKIKNGYIIFTHCHSSAVVKILLKAKSQGKKFVVHNIETRPLFQGRMTAKDLANAKIKVNHFIDSAARLALKKADLMIFGADAIQSDGTVINKIGTELFVDIANQYEVPCYACTDSWKFDPKSIYGIDEPIENRNRDEVWKGAPKNITIHNPAFEIIEAQKISGIISELGIFRPGVFVEEVKHVYPWLV